LKTLKDSFFLVSFLSIRGVGNDAKDICMLSGHAQADDVLYGEL
jgi:hypothetical protein